MGHQTTMRRIAAKLHSSPRTNPARGHLSCPLTHHRPQQMGHQTTTRRPAAKFHSRRRRPSPDTPGAIPLHTSGPPSHPPPWFR
ncbi:hypothetical protein JB92DRAFT_2889851 [Gautieria morchelliformis]|nr:hypothetical protein JB92DRAFT_2889851 [Gautieria morchelliformis]